MGGLDPAAKVFVVGRVEAANRAIKKLRNDLTAVFLDHLPRHDEFSLTDIAVGTVDQDVSWLVPITGDYTVVATPVTGATFVGLLSATLKAGTKTPTGCTLIVANRALVSVGAAAFDVLAFPIGG